MFYFFINIIFLVTSGLFSKITEFFVWLVTLNYSSADVSAAGEIFVKLASFTISFNVVGFIFKALGWFNSDAMKITYFIVSTLVSFVLCWLVMIFETHLLVFVIVLAVLLLVIGAVYITLFICSRKEKLKNGIN